MEQKEHYTASVPYDIEVEQALLGAILVDNRAIESASQLIKPDRLLPIRCTSACSK